MRLVALILTCCLLTGAARADVLHLAGGKTYEGQVELKGARYFVIDRDMKWAFKKDRVTRVVKSESFMDRYDARMGPTDCNIKTYAGSRVWRGSSAGAKLSRGPARPRACLTK